MDWLVEKAAELGVASIQPLVTARSVLRLAGERAGKKRGHWQGIAVAACEQCGRNRVPVVHEVADLADWLATAPGNGVRVVLSLSDGAQDLSQAAAHPGPVLALSGPEGGLTAQEEEAARVSGFAPVSLGPRTLRAETAPLALLAALTLGP
jgi:16S rRNA (uracil1498-N3)-methyltransferase